MDLVFSDIHADIDALELIVDLVTSTEFKKEYGAGRPLEAPLCRCPDPLPAPGVGSRRRNPFCADHHWRENTFTLSR